MDRLTDVEKEDFGMTLLMLECDRSDTISRSEVFKNFNQ